ncbi:MAG: peptidoglycan -binding protein [Gammaproteobacteria bacterium]|nr:peptidoglycan -binding protein [Gammaproteobacteria bacterium]
MLASHRRHQTVNVWPGFVDALAAVLLVFIFMLLIFIVGQFFLTDVLIGRDKALDQLSRDINKLSSVLSLEREKRQQQAQELNDSQTRLQATLLQRDILQQRGAVSEQTVARQRQELQLSQRQLTQSQQELMVRMHTLELATEQEQKLNQTLQQQRQQLTKSQTALQTEQQLSASAQQQLALFSQQLNALKTQLATLSAELDLSQAEIKQRDIKLSSLGKKLNLALADKVRQLKKYRSEFFGRLRETLGDQAGLRIEGDRFVFQSELLFASGSAELGKAGQQQLLKLAKSLRTVAKKIPKDIQWILRVDGHTDRRAIKTPLYASNWELSSARAISIVKYLIQQGISPTRLAAAGFGEFQPLDKRRNREAYQRNRRIEIKLTQP